MEETMSKKFIEMSYDEKKRLADEKLERLREMLRDSGKQITNFYKHVPKSIERLYLEVLVAKTTSKTKRIKLKCLDCSGFSRDEVTKCEMQHCALWEIRPFQEKLIAN